MMGNDCKYESNTVISFFGRGQTHQVKTREKFVHRGFLHVALLKIEDREILKSPVRKYCSNYNMAE